MRARRSLSQNFLVDHNIRRKIVDTLEPGPEDEVIEIGPGHGELSELIVGRVARLTLVEKDDRLAPLLVERWGGEPGIVIVHADALEVDLSKLAFGRRPLKLLSNVPYSITSPLLFRFLDVPEVDRIVVMVQEEVARRICADPGTRIYGALTVGVQVQARPRLAFRVGRGAFRPVPRVDSAVVVLEPRPNAPGIPALAAVRTLARECFSRRRKQLRNILRSSPRYRLDAEQAGTLLTSAGIAPEARPEQLSPAEFTDLAGRLAPFRSDAAIG